MLAIGEELVDDGSEEQKVNERPDEVRPWSWGNIGFLAAVVDAVVGAGNGVDIRAQEEEIGEQIHNFEQNTVLPGVCHGIVRD